MIYLKNRSPGPQEEHFADLSTSVNLVLKRRPKYFKLERCWFLR